MLKIISTHSQSLAFGLCIAMHHAAKLFEGDDSFGWEAVGEFAKAYGDYAFVNNPQFEDWWGNPVFMLARVNSEKGGPEMARELSELAEGEGGKLHVRLAEYLHTTPGKVQEWLADPVYDGPLRILTDPTLKSQLKDFGERSQPLSHYPQFDLLRQRLLRHYSMLRMSNAMGEEWVKYYKALLPQQIGKGMAWCEVKLRSIIRARIIAGMGDVLAPPTLEELREWRKANGDSDRRRFATPVKAPLELPPEITHDGEESDESGHSRESEQEEEEEYAALTVARLKELLEKRGLSTSGARPLLIARLEEDDEDGSDEGNGDDGDEDAAMQQQQEEEEEEGEEEDLWALSYREVQHRLKEMQRTCPWCRTRVGLPRHARPRVSLTHSHLPAFVSLSPSAEPATGRFEDLVPRLEMALEAQHEEREDEGDDGGHDGDDEADEAAGVADPNDSLFRSQIRLVPKAERTTVLHLGAAVWCFDEDPKARQRGQPHPKGTFFALHIREHYRSEKTYIQADTLMFVPEANLYVVDPDFANSTRSEDRRAHMDLIFTVETQPLMPVADGYQGRDAWRIERREPAAARARALIEEAAGESDESGHGDDMEGIE